MFQSYALNLTYFGPLTIKRGQILTHVAHAAFTEICHQVQCNIERTNKSQPGLALLHLGIL